MNLPKVRIIELYGLPGCGKSTLSKYLLSFLQKRYPNNVIKRADISGVINRWWNHPLFLFFYLFLQILKPNNFRFKISLLSYAVSFPLNRYSIIYLLYTMIVVDLYSKNATKIIVLDEGIIQFLSAIPHDVLIDNSDMIDNISRQLYKMPIEVLYVECHIEKMVNLQRIKQRNRPDRFAFNDGLEELLTKKEANLALIASFVAKNKITIDMLKMCEYNTTEIINKLFE